MFPLPCRTEIIAKHPISLTFHPPIISVISLFIRGDEERVQRWRDSGEGAPEKEMRARIKIRQIEWERWKGEKGKYDERVGGLSLDRVRIKIYSVLFFPPFLLFWSKRSWGGACTPHSLHYSCKCHINTSILSFLPLFLAIKKAFTLALIKTLTFLNVYIMLVHFILNRPDYPTAVYCVDSVLSILSECSWHKT